MGEQFNQLFDEWAPSYDATVSGRDVEYREVFRNYETILEKITERSAGFVLEFGVGTGNLTKKLIDKGLDVIGIEPSENMRKIAQTKLPHACIERGNFLFFPKTERKVDTIVSSYAFHHLTDPEKEQAFRQFTSILSEKGKIVFADTIFKDEQARQQAYNEAQANGYLRLANDLNTEFYTTIPSLEKMLATNGYEVHFEQLNDFVWLMEAVRSL